MKKLLLGLLISSLIPSMALAQGFTGGGGSGLPYSTGLAAALPGSCTAGSSVYYATNTLTWYFCMDGTYSAGIAKGADGSYRGVLTNNTSISPTASADEWYFEANIFKINQNGTEYAATLSPTGGQVTFSGPTAARTLTMSDANTTIPANPVGTTDTQTLTNKTLTAPAITAAEVDGHTDQTALTAAQVSGTVITNQGQAAADVFLLLPTAAAGYSFMATVATAQSNHWGVEAGASDCIYLLNSDGTITKGDDAAGVVMTAAQVGQHFACWTFKTGASAYDWACKAVAIGTSTFAAHAHSTP